MPSVSAILLAAGASTRMGAQKALLDWHGAPLIDYQLTQLSSVDEIEQIIVVTGHQPEAITGSAARYARAEIAHNAAHASGKVSSILTGLRAVAPDAQAILLLGVDQPRPNALLRALVREHLAARAAITAPARGGHRGHPILFARSMLTELLSISEDTQGIRAVLERHAADVHDVEIDDPSVHVDLNEPGDFPPA